MRGGEATRSGKRPLRSLTVTEKIDAIDRVHDGESKASVARDIGVPESTLRGWCKSEPKIRSMARNSSTPESEAHSPASSAGANLYTSNAGASHSSEDEGPAMKRFKAASDISLSLNSGVEGTESNETKLEKRFDYPGLLALAGYRPENSSLLLQQLGMLSAASSNNFMPMTQAVPNMGAVGLVENGLQYTKSGVNPTTNNKRHSIAAIAPSQLETVNKLSTRKSLPPAAEAPATPVAASPNQQMPAATLAYDNKNGTTNPKKIEESLWMWLIQQKTQLGQQAAQQTAQLCQDRSWFWQWYKQCGFPAATSATAPVEITNAAKKSPSKARAMLDSVLCNNNSENVKRSVKDLETQGVPSSVEEAVEHGEKLFKWLDKCSDPSITRLQLIQLRCLLDTLKTCKKKTSTGLKQSRK